MIEPLAVAGLGVGFLVGLTGVGGGALMTPILLLVFGVAPAAAVGTDLWFAVVTKLVGGTVLAQRGSVDWQVVRRLWAGSLPAALLTLLTLQLTGNSPELGRIITLGLGVVLLVSAAATLGVQPMHRWSTQRRRQEPQRFKRWQPAATVTAGAAIGAMVTLTSVGAGALGAAALFALYPLRMNAERVVGTDIAHAVPLALVAGMGHLALGNVQPGLLGWLLLGSIPGVLLGTRLCGRLPDVVTRRVIAVMLLLSGLKLLW